MKTYTVELNEKELLKVHTALMNRGHHWMDKSIKSLKNGDKDSSESEHRTAYKYYELARKFTTHHE